MTHGASAMKKSALTAMLVCATCFWAGESVASNAAPDVGTAQARPESKKMKLTELIKRLEAANPWTVEKVSKALDTEMKKPSESYFDNIYVDYYGAHQRDYGDGLIIDKADFRLNAKTNRMVRTTLMLDQGAKCLTRESIKKMYPDMVKGETFSTAPHVLENSPPITIRYREVYFVDRPWGHFSFYFGTREKRDDYCLDEFDIFSILESQPVKKYNADKEYKMKFEELLQKIEAASPWTLEKVRKELGLEFISNNKNNDVFVYEANRILYEEDLFFQRIILRLDAKTNKAIRLIMEISSTANCFTLDRIKKTYPDIEYNLLPPDIPAGRAETISYYQVKRSWGRLSFGFDKKERPDCLCDIFLTPEKE